MNEQQRIDVLKCVTVARALVQISPILCKTLSYWFPSRTLSFSEVRPTVLEIQKRGHMRTYLCTLSSTFVKCFANGSLTTYQISARPAGRSMLILRFVCYLRQNFASRSARNKPTFSICGCVCTYRVSHKFCNILAVSFEVLYY